MIKAIAVLVVMIGVNAFLVFAIVKASVRLDDTLRRYFVTKVGSSEYSVIPMRNTSGTLVGGEDGDQEVPGKLVPGENGKQDYFDEYGNVNSQNNGRAEQNPYSGYGGTEPRAGSQRDSYAQRFEKEVLLPTRLPGTSSEISSSARELIRQMNENGKVERYPGGVEITGFSQTGLIPKAEETNAARYKNSDLKDDYRTIRKLSVLDKAHAISVVKEAQSSDADVRGKAVSDILRLLDYDTAFAMSSLDSTEQIRMLYDTISPEAIFILEEYLKAYPRRFSSISFYGYIQGLSVLTDSNYYLYAGIDSDCEQDYGQDVKTAVDSDIAEGIRIVYKDKLYDYSI